MDDMKLGLVESKFSDIIWRSEPLPSRELVKLCEAELNWKKPTTYTVLRRLGSLQGSRADLRRHHERLRARRLLRLLGPRI